MSNTQLRVPPPLPATPEGWIRDIKVARSINDLVEDIHSDLLRGKSSELYQSYLFAIYDAQAVEGSLASDNVMAAQMIRERARTLDDSHPLTKEKLATISQALGVVLRRYHLSRKERRQLVAGQVVPIDGNGD
jgi:hypothetical protein